MIDIEIPYLTAYTDLSISTLSQRQSVFYSGSLNLLIHNLQQLAGDVQQCTSNDYPKDEKLRSAKKQLLSFFGVI